MKRVNQELLETSEYTREVLARQKQMLEDILSTDIVFCEDDKVIKAYQTALVIRDQLNKWERNLILILTEMTATDVAKMIGVSRKYISGQKKIIIEKIKSYVH